MDILKTYKDYPDALKGAVLAIGNFDGVHRGHQAVLQAALRSARAEGAPAGAMTFEPHPRAFFQPGRPLFRLTPEPLKLKLLAAFGLDLAVVLPFNKALASLTADDFVREVLVEGLGVSQVVTGGDFHFGKGREGDPARMRALGQKHGFAVLQVSAVGEKGEDFSSSQVRALLRAGDVQAAAHILGYWWRIAGEVTGGDRRGHGLGFPTANVPVPQGCELRHGIYAVRVFTAAGRYAGAAYLGTRPTFGGGAAAIEAFLFDFDGDLYGQEIEIELIDWLRGDEAFPDAGVLKEQMAADCEKARAAVAAIDSGDPMYAYPLGRGLGG